MAKARPLKNIHRLIEEATTIQPPELTFVADLNIAIEKENNSHQRKPSQTYKPSSMKCIRNMYFQVTGADRDPDYTGAVLVGILQSGTDRHERLQKAVTSMKAMKMDCEYVDIEKFIKQRKITGLTVVSKQGMETKLYHEGLNISFLCDGIIKYKGQYYILEIKTEMSTKFWKREGIAEEHIPQGVSYSTLFGINQVMFLYENRDTTDKKAYILNVDDTMKYDMVIGKIEECDSYVKKLKIPPKPLTITKRDCQYCPYKTVCNNAGK